jgi:hypothetical protein
VAVHIYTQTIYRTTQITTEQHKYIECCRVRVVPRLCEFYSGICLTTEEKARKSLSQGKKNLSHSRVYKLPKTPPHIYKALTNTHLTKPTHTHTTKQYKTTTVLIKTKCIITFSIGFLSDLIVITVFSIYTFYQSNCKYFKQFFLSNQKRAVSVDVPSTYVLCMLLSVPSLKFRIFHKFLHVFLHHTSC